MKPTLGLLRALAACALFIATLPGAYAQDHPHYPMGGERAARLHAAGLDLQRQGDELGAFAAFLRAAEEGHPPAQRRLGEIYDNGNSAVEPDFTESIRWYQRAREGGEIIPPPKPRLVFPFGP